VTAGKVLQAKIAWAERHVEGASAVCRRRCELDAASMIARQN
jgi:hypothetical protein